MEGRFESPDEDAVLSPFAEVELEPEVRDRLLASALTLSSGIYAGSFERRGDFLQACEGAQEAIRGSAVSAAIEQLKAGSLLALQLRGLPVDPSLPPAPIDGGAPFKKETFVSEGVACAVAQELGYPSILLGEKREALVHQITPVPGREATQSNEGQVGLKWHQDLSPNPDVPSLRYDMFMPDWLILTGVQKGSGDTQTYLALVDEALQHIDEPTRAILQEKRFVTNPPDSFLKEEHVEARDFLLPSHAVLTSRDGHFETSFDSSSNVRPADPQDAAAAEALKRFEEALTLVKRTVLIEPGTQIVFNNRRVIHGRGPVAQENDFTQRRWIQRVYVFDFDRVTREVIDKPHLSLQLGGGLLRVSNHSDPGPELMRLAS